MVKGSVEIQSETGLHARPASLLVREAGKFSSKLSLVKNDKKVDLKSILGVMSLAVSKGETVEIEAEGTDEEEALSHLIEFCKQLS